MKRKRLGIASAETPFYILLGARGGGGEAERGGDFAALQEFFARLDGLLFKKKQIKNAKRSEEHIRFVSP